MALSLSTVHFLSLERHADTVLHADKESDLAKSVAAAKDEGTGRLLLELSLEAAFPAQAITFARLVSL